MFELKIESWQEEGQWQEQIKNQVNTIEKLNQYIDITPDEEKAIKTLNIRWGTTPYYASLMDKSNPDCPIRRMVIPSMSESDNKYGIPNYLVFKENREKTDRFGEKEKRPDISAKRLFKNEKVKTMVADELKKVFEERDISEGDVIEIITDAIEIAREKEDPGTMLRGSEQFIKLMDMYPTKTTQTETLQIDVSNKILDEIESEEQRLLATKTVSDKV